MREFPARTLPTLATADIPVSTYRVQFHAGFRFADATAAIPYLKSLGVSHLYSSPYLKARKGSTHGYDVVDHNTLNPEVGSQAEFDEMCATLEKHGMKQLIDIVPNHMGVLEADNAWWRDVMEHGRQSEYADVFDIDWDSPVDGLRDKVLIGLLGDQYGAVLENGDFKLGFDASTGGFSLSYFDHCFPLDPAGTVTVLEAAPLPASATPAKRESLRKLLDGFAALSPASVPLPLPVPGSQVDLTTTAPKSRAEHALALRAGLSTWVTDTAWAAAWIDECLAAMNGTKGDKGSFDRLDALLHSQPWRLAYWRTTGHEVNYRRFFDVNTLAAIRNEKLRVFEATHHTILNWLAEGRVAGLRIDHPDGLSDPSTYLQRLQERFAAVQPDEGNARALYVVVEKILGDDEVMPEGWQTHGDTGYHFSNQVNGVFVDTRASGAFDDLYEGFVGQRMDYDETLHTAKHLVMSTSLAADLELLTDGLYKIARGDRTTCDFTRATLHDAIAELAANFPVYRTYLASGTHGGEDVTNAREPSEADRRYMLEAANSARKYALGSSMDAVDYLCKVLLQAHQEPDLERRKAMLHFAVRWQQFTSPVMAKAMEDTTFYRYLRLVSLNDVGGDPRRFGMSVEAFHEANDERARLSPHTILGTSTHDSKRSEDVRARLDVLSEMPDAWNEAIGRWRAMNDQHAENAPMMHGDRSPTANHEYLLYQTLVGAWPILAPGSRPTAAEKEDFRQRVKAYMQKATREAKDATSWLEPDEAYQEALDAFVDRCLGYRPGAEGDDDTWHDSGFLKDVDAFVQAIGPFGAANSLGIVALKLTSPGVPDVYQSCESWNLSLVDPDNRRHVDFGDLANKLRSVESAAGDDALSAIATNWTDGRIKMLVTSRLLAHRAANATLFRDGDYEPLAVKGEAAEHIVAFARRGSSTGGDGQDISITITGRLLHKLTRGEAAEMTSKALWKATTVLLPEGLTTTRWRDAISGRIVEGRFDDGVSGLAVGDVFGLTTVAVLTPAT